MPRLTMTRGLPASGKTTWAREVQVGDPQVVLVSKDELRAMLHSGRWSRGNEKQVLAMRDAVVVDALARGRNVIVHDTNLVPAHGEALRALAREHGASFEVRDFTDVPLATCLARDAARPRPVGAGAIRDMWRRHLWSRPVPVASDGPRVVLCDLDGTLALIGDRSPYDTTGRCIDDGLNGPVAEVLRLVRHAGTGLVLMSGREDLVRPATEAWLATHGIEWDELLMRPAGDRRRDSVVKRELYEEHVAGRYDVAWVIDDRPQVVRFWREEIGLFVFDVNQTGEDF